MINGGKVSYDSFLQEVEINLEQFFDFFDQFFVGVEDNYVVIGFDYCVVVGNNYFVVVGDCCLVIGLVNDYWFGEIVDQCCDCCVMWLVDLVDLFVDYFGGIGIVVCDNFKCFGCFLVQ